MSEICAAEKKELSSANSLVKLRRCLAISFIYTKNKRGPRTDYWGTPANIDFMPENIILDQLSAFSDLNNFLSILKAFL